jgi:polyferredoxin
MTRLHRPRGLIRYDSQKAFTGQRTRWIRPRTILYGVLLAIGAGVAGTTLATVRPANLNITRIIGAPYVVDAASVRNQFFLRVVNKRNVPTRFVVHVDGAPAGLHQTGFTAPVVIEPLGEIVQPLVLQISRKDYTGPFMLHVQVQDDRGSFTLKRDAEFLGPDARLLREEDEENEHDHDNHEHGH